MDEREVKQTLAILKAAYPAFYANQTRQSLEAIVSLWCIQFAEDDSRLVAAAVQALIASDEKGFPPHIGAVKAMMRKLTQPKRDTELEAWNIVRKAIYHASMSLDSRKIGDDRTSAERNFAKLPTELQELVGSPAQLARWENLDDDEIDTVVASNFQRSYRERMRENSLRAAIPQQLLQEIQAKPMLTEKEGV